METIVIEQDQRDPHFVRIKTDTDTWRWTISLSNFEILDWNNALAALETNKECHLDDKNMFWSLHCKMDENASKQIQCFLELQTTGHLYEKIRTTRTEIKLATLKYIIQKIIDAHIKYNDDRQVSINDTPPIFERIGILNRLGPAILFMIIIFMMHYGMQ